MEAGGQEESKKAGENQKQAVQEWEEQSCGEGQSLLAS